MATKKVHKNKRARPQKNCNVYVIELDSAVLEDKKFRDKNPQHDPEKACLYVGMTSCDPDERLEQHLRGYKASRYVRKHGQHLRRRLFERFNPMTRVEAEQKEPELAEDLRKRGFAVWQN